MGTLTGESILAGTNVQILTAWRKYTTGSRDLASPVFMVFTGSSLSQHSGAPWDLWPQKHRSNRNTKSFSFFFNGWITLSSSCALLLDQCYKMYSLAFWLHSHNYSDRRSACLSTGWWIHLGHSQPLPAHSACNSPHAFPFINGTFLDEVPWLSFFRQPLISPGPLVYFKHGWPQLSSSHPPQCQVLLACKMTNKTQTRYAITIWEW